MRGHKGAGLTLGHGFHIVSSTKQKLNTRSSTKSELVGIDDLSLTESKRKGLCGEAGGFKIMSLF